MSFHVQNLFDLMQSIRMYDAWLFSVGSKHGRINIHTLNNVFLQLSEFQK